MKVRQLFISPGHNFFGHHGQPPGAHPTIELPEIECVAGRGIRGDRFFDFKADYKGQITFFELEVYEALLVRHPVRHSLGVGGSLGDGGCARLKSDIPSAGGTRRNVIVEGADLNVLVGQPFEVQGVKFLGTTQCSPCYWMDHVFGAGAEQFLQGRGGLRARILSDGNLRVEP